MNFDWDVGAVATALIGVLTAGVLAASAPARGADRVDVEGQSSSGSNDQLATAETAGSLSGGESLEIIGWIDSLNGLDVDFFRFDVLDPSLEIFLEIDFADDRVGSEDVDRGLDTALWVFDDEGRLIALNDDSDFFGSGIDNDGSDPGSDQLGDRDAFIGGLDLEPGAYYAAVAWYGHSAQAESQPGIVYTGLVESGLRVDAAVSDSDLVLRNCVDPVADQCVGAYVLAIRTRFVPEPALRFGIFAGCVTLLGFASRRQGERRGSSRIASLR